MEDLAVSGGEDLRPVLCLAGHFNCRAHGAARDPATQTLEEPKTTALGQSSVMRSQAQVLAHGRDSLLRLRQKIAHLDTVDIGGRQPALYMLSPDARAAHAAGALPDEF